MAFVSGEEIEYGSYVELLEEAEGGYETYKGKDGYRQQGHPARREYRTYQNQPRMTGGYAKHGRQVGYGQREQREYSPYQQPSGGRYVASQYAPAQRNTIF